MESSPSSGAFAGYNARGTAPAEVARTFIAPESYWRLTTSDHQALIGPRGSGKTSLLKMLVDEGLDAWSGEDGDRARGQVRFTGVFVPADKLWAGQLRDISDSLDLDLRRPFGQAAFAFMALRSLASAAHRRVHGPWAQHQHNRVSLSASDEADICRLVAEAWHVPLAVGTLASLRDISRTNLAALSILGRKAARPLQRGAKAMQKLLDSELLDVDFYVAASAFVGLFNDRCGQSGALWAFLIDELEFLPIGTRKQIQNAIQGNDPALVFKVSLAPYRDVSGNLNQPLQGMPFADYDPVPLGRWKREQEDPFVERLFEQSVSQQRQPDALDVALAGSVSAKELLGRGGFEPSGRDSYADSGENGSLIRELAAFDDSFAAYLEKIRVDPRNLNALSRAQYDRLRAAMPVVRLRHEYWKPDEHGGRAKRSRKGILALYAGRDSVLAMSEGNPRWIKALAYALQSRWDGKTLPIPPDRQLKAVEEVASQYLGYLRAVDVEHQMDDLYDNTDVEAPSVIDPVPYSLILEIGNEFKRQVHGHEFHPEPRLAFRDDAGEPMTTGVLQALMFLGAIVVDGKAESGDTDRLRLAHLFAPCFRLPLRTTKTISLRGLLDGDVVLPEDNDSISDMQLELLPDDEHDGDGPRLR